MFVRGTQTENQCQSYFVNVIILLPSTQPSLLPVSEEAGKPREEPRVVDNITRLEPEKIYIYQLSKSFPLVAEGLPNIDVVIHLLPII